MVWTCGKGRRGVLLLAFLLTFPIHTPPLKAAETPLSSSTAEATVSVASTTEDQDGEAGIATYYAKRYQGRRTSSGARYRHDGMTAAHPFIPFGTRVRVVSLANGREVTVTINDRCRKRRSATIDLSRAAARQLGFLGKGSARVQIIPQEESSS